MTSKPPSFRFRSALLFCNPYVARKTPDLNDGHGKNMDQLAEVQNQGQALFVPQHGAAVRHVRRRVVQERFRIRRETCQSLSSAAIPTCVSSLCSSPESTATIILRGNRPGRRPSVTAISTAGIIVPRKLKNAHRGTAARGKHARHQGPVHHFFHFEHGETKPLASGAKDTKLPGGRRVLARSGYLGQLIGLHIRRQRDSNRFLPASGKPPYFAQEIDRRKWFREVPVSALLLSPKAVTRWLIFRLPQ